MNHMMIMVASVKADQTKIETSRKYHDQPHTKHHQRMSVFTTETKHSTRQQKRNCIVPMELTPTRFERMHCPLDKLHKIQRCIDDGSINAGSISLNESFASCVGDPTQERFKHGHFQIMHRIRIQMMGHGMGDAPFTVAKEGQIEVTHTEIIAPMKEIMC